MEIDGSGHTGWENLGEGETRRWRLTVEEETDRRHTGEKKRMCQTNAEEKDINLKEKRNECRKRPRSLNLSLQPLLWSV